MSTNANCILLAVKGKHYYAEEFGKFIPITKEEYERISACPYRRYFTTALKKHLQWFEADRKGTTLSLAELLAWSSAGGMPVVATKVVRRITALSAGLYDRYVLQISRLFVARISGARQRWQDASTVAEAVIAPARLSLAQQAWTALDLRVDRWMQANCVLRLTGRYVDWCQKVRTWPEVHCIGLAVLGLVVIGDGWCGGPVSRAFSVVPQPILFALGVLFIAVTAANLMVTTVLLIAFALVLPAVLWRSWEVRSGFVVRHLLPNGILWRYRAWRLRRLSRRKSNRT